MSVGSGQVCHVLRGASAYRTVHAMSPEKLGNDLVILRRAPSHVSPNAAIAHLASRKEGREQERSGRRERGQKEGVGRIGWTCKLSYIGRGGGRGKSVCNNRELAYLCLTHHESC